VCLIFLCVHGDWRVKVHCNWFRDQQR